MKDFIGELIIVFILLSFTFYIKPLFIYVQNPDPEMESICKFPCFQDQWAYKKPWESQKYIYLKAKGKIK